MSFEDRVTLGLAQWITFVEINESAESLRIGLTHNPEDSATEKSIYFTGVTRVVSNWVDRDDGCLESIIGAHEECEGDQLRYTIHTEQRELSIWARHTAAIRGAGA